MGKAPAFQFYANDFMDATRLWEANAVGLYVRCLCIQWTHGSIPADLKILARAVHCDRAELEACWPELSKKFAEQGDGTLKNKRLEQVRERQKEISDVRSEAGKAGAIAKANAKSLADDLLLAKTKQRKVKVEGEAEREDGSMKAEVEPTFAQWFDLYDKRRAVGECRAKWATLDQPTREAIMEHTGRYVKAQPDKTYRKDPLRYLSKRGWEDEIVTTKQNGQARTEDDYLAKRRAIIEANAKFYRERDAFEGGGTGGVPGAQNDPGAR